MVLVMMMKMVLVWASVPPCPNIYTSSLLFWYAAHTSSSSIGGYLEINSEEPPETMPGGYQDVSAAGDGGYADVTTSAAPGYADVSAGDDFGGFNDEVDEDDSDDSDE